MQALSESPAAAGQFDDLRDRIFCICQSIRFAALTYAGWILFQVVRVWSDSAFIERAYGAWLKINIQGIQGWQQAAGFAVHFAIWLLTAAGCYAVWRLFSGYLAGRIFTVDAALWLRRIAMFGLAAEVADLLTRPLIWMIVSAHLPEGHRMIGASFNPNDLLILLLLCGFLALAQVFKAAAELAEDNARIV